MTLSLEQFREQILFAGLISAEELDRVVKSIGSPVETTTDLADALVQSGKLTRFQAQTILQGKGESLLLGVYVIKDKIGAGGMGEVYLAEHSRMKRDVVLKVLPPKLVDNKESVQRFHREVQAAAQLNHPNIVTAYDANEEEGNHFYVMEYVEGRDLSTLVKEMGPLSVELALKVILQAAEGLKYAHQKGIIHRDIKPGNLLLENTGTVKILDMGLARLHSAGETEDGKGLTDSGIVMGTVDYMAPEQAMDTRCADERSDIYSLGCTLFFLLTRLPLFAETTVMKKLMAHQNQEPPTLAGRRSDVSPEVESLYRKMVAKKPEYRFQSMADVMAAITKCMPSVATDTSDSPAFIADSDLQTYLAGSSQETTPAMLATATIADSDPIYRDTTPPAATGDTDRSLTRPPANDNPGERSGSRTNSKWRTWTGGIAAIVLLLMLAYFWGNSSSWKERHQSGTRSGHEDDLNDANSNGANSQNRVGELTISDSEILSRLLQKVDRLGGEVISWNPENEAHYTLALETPMPKEADFGMTLRLNELPSLSRADLEEVFELCRTISRHHPLSLDLSRSKISPDDLNSMAQLSFLTLSLDGNPEIDDRIASVLKSVKGLQILGLQETAVTDKTIEQLQPIDSLEILNLAFTKVTAQSRATLSGFKRLQTLNLTGTNWDESSVQSLQTDLPQCEVIWDNEKPDDAQTGQVPEVPSSP